MVMEGVSSVLPLTLNFVDVYENASDDEQNYIQNLALFLGTFLGAHLKVRLIASPFFYYEHSHELFWNT